MTTAEPSTPQTSMAQMSKTQASQTQASTTKRIVITGASGAIGQALAKAYAQAGVTLVLQGRQRDLLQALASDCQGAGAQTEIVELDVSDVAAVRQWGKSLGAVDLLVVNAGKNIHIDADSLRETESESDQLLAINLLSAIALVQSVLPTMQTQGHGQIALVSSLAAWRGLPTTPSYSASKAGLKAYGESLRTNFADKGIKVNVVLPGYVKSAMCDDMPGPKPFLWTPERAARVIKRGLDANRGRITFPFWLSLGTHLLACMPDGMASWFLKRLGYGANDKAS